MTHLIRNLLEQYQPATITSNTEFIIRALSKAYYCLKFYLAEYSFFVLEAFLFYFIKVTAVTTKVNVEQSRHVFGVFYDTFIDNKQKANMLLCLKFFTLMGKMDSDPLYFMRNKLIDYLDSIHLERFRSELATRLAFFGVALELVRLVQFFD